MNERPEVVPALQEWTGGTGEFRLGPESRVVCADERLGSRLAGELGIGHATEGPGDVVLEIIPSDGRAEGYRIEATPGRVTITASTARGLFYGTRTLVQILRTGAVPCGVAHDWPDYPVRGYMLDVGRRYVTPELIHRLIRLMGHYKLNELQLHLNDNEIKAPDGDWGEALHGFRLRSPAFPGLAPEESYSRDDWDGFEELAAAHAITLVPEIDAPAHSRAFISFDPSVGHDGGNSDHLDLANPAATELVKAVFTEFVPWFRGPAVHFGADEYYQSKALWKQFFNDMAAHVRSLGKQPRAWGGFTRLSPTGDTAGFDPDVVINSWNNGFYGPEGAREDSYALINSNDDLLYIVPEADYYHGAGLDAEWLYDHWEPHVFADGQSLDPGDPRLLGAMPALWNDLVRADYTEERMYELIEHSLGVLAQKMWSGAKAGLPYRDFVRLLQRLNA
ncbi:hexosaminidase [Streptosporangium canum]|uniref:Hexosaminidase n=1 Tax=Streptosporangium canum TaxID=324952 RepID=A0A1I3WUF4_9ACTN|nr:family 20 glycosylhydrolase [Streptosporangium canum]SFK10980.1 hexosaminidase [Streptosporangium canum]